MKGKFKSTLDLCYELLYPATAEADVRFNNSEVGGVGELGTIADPQVEKQDRHEEQCRQSSNSSCQACSAWQVGQVGEGEREVDEDRQSGDRVCWGARVNGRKLRKYIVESGFFFLDSSSNFILECQCSIEYEIIK